MESLDECLASHSNGLQVYASCMELNGENIIFLTRVLSFQKACQHSFHSTCKSTAEFRRARAIMFRTGVSIFISLVHTATASYPINIEAPIYNRLNDIFGPATKLIAGVKRKRSTSADSDTSATVTPWDDQNATDDSAASETNIQMQAMTSDGLSGSSSNIKPNESSERIINVATNSVQDGGSQEADERALQGIKIPADFDEMVFDAAFKSVRYMVWTETWQRYMAWKRTSGENLEG